MTDLLAAVITLEAQAAGELDPFQGRALHALFLDLTGRAAPALHDSDDLKPFTSSNLSGLRALVAKNSNWAAVTPHNMRRSSRPAACSSPRSSNTAIRPAPASKARAPKACGSPTCDVRVASGRPRPHLQHILVAAALDLRRITAWLMDVPRAHTRTAPFVRSVQAAV